MIHFILVHGLYLYVRHTCDKIDKIFCNMKAFEPQGYPLTVLSSLSHRYHRVTSVTLCHHELESVPTESCRRRLSCRGKIDSYPDLDYYRGVTLHLREVAPIHTLASAACRESDGALNSRRQWYTLFSCVLVFRYLFGIVYVCLFAGVIFVLSCRFGRGPDCSVLLSHGCVDAGGWGGFRHQGSWSDQCGCTRQRGNSEARKCPG